MNTCCKFCGGSELRPDMELILETEGGNLYLMKDQTHPGRMLLASKRHVRKITDLTGEEYAAFTQAAFKAAKAVTEVLKPDKINYLVLGDLGTHLHLHIVPKYEDGKDWGRVFLTDEPEPIYIADAEFKGRIEKIRMAMQDIESGDENIVS